jgi:hypothetical protein
MIIAIPISQIEVMQSSTAEKNLIRALLSQTKTREAISRNQK